VIELLSKIPVDRALLVVFLAGQLYAQFKSVRHSLRSQGERLGAVEKSTSGLEAGYAALAARIAALEASGKRG